MIQADLFRRAPDDGAQGSPPSAPSSPVPDALASLGARSLVGAGWVDRVDPWLEAWGASLGWTVDELMAAPASDGWTAWAWIFVHGQMTMHEGARWRGVMRLVWSVEAAGAQGMGGEGWEVRAGVAVEVGSAARPSLRVLSLISVGALPQGLVARVPAAGNAEPVVGALGDAMLATARERGEAQRCPADVLALVTGDAARLAEMLRAARGWGG